MRGASTLLAGPDSVFLGDSLPPDPPYLRAWERHEGEPQTYQSGSTMALVRNANFSKSHSYAEIFIIQKGTKKGRRNGIYPGATVTL